ncbi:MAG: YbaK/EbsC family protein [Thermodesulfobacteriota bacterium]|nr:YbaK/EbsC family protein [Thermodesulfobacteriota bacterium]
MTQKITLEEKIVDILTKNNIAYDVFEHDPVYTNPDMAEALGVDENETVKSMVAETSENNMIVIVLPGNHRIDWKLTARCAGTKKITFARPEMVPPAVGCEVGCVPPFGHETSLPVFMSPALGYNEYLYFNPGVHNKSFKIRFTDLKTLCNPVMLTGGGEDA